MSPLTLPGFAPDLVGALIVPAILMSIIRRVGALLLETDDKWTVARRYISLETLARETENPDIRLPAVAS